MTGFSTGTQTLKISLSFTGNANVEGKALGNMLEVSMQPVRLADVCTIGVL